MNYVSCEEARAVPGLRLVLSEGSPGPWSEAAKGVLHARGVTYVPVRQVSLGENEELYAWTGMRNAPIAMYENERPRHSWLDILFLAERLGAGPSLLPASREGRAECIGLSHEICGEGGLGWNRRLNIFKMLITAAGGDPSATPLPPRAFADYDGRREALELATEQLIEILEMLHSRLTRQMAAGSSFLVGSHLTAADIYLATFLGMLHPQPKAQNPMPDFLRDLYSSGEPRLRNAITARLVAHRDAIYGTILPLPLDF